MFHFLSPHMEFELYWHSPLQCSSLKVSSNVHHVSSQKHGKLPKSARKRALLQNASVEVPGVTGSPPQQLKAATMLPTSSCSWIKEIAEELCLLRFYQCGPHIGCQSLSPIFTLLLFWIFVSSSILLSPQMASCRSMWIPSAGGDSGCSWVFFRALGHKEVN